MSVSSVLRALKSAAAGRAIVRVVRTVAADTIDGYVNKVSADLCLLQPVRDRIDFDGFDIVRVADISAVLTSPKAGYYATALRLKGLHPASTHPIQIGSVREVLKSGCRHTPLLVIHREVVAANECEIGRPHTVTGGKYRLEWMNSLGQFEQDDEVYKVADVTRIQFEGEYERTLALVASAVTRTAHRQRKRRR